MVIYRSSDSLSRCDPNPYSTIYDVKKRSDIKSQQPVSDSRASIEDTIEFSGGKLKEEALSCLRNTSKYVVAENGFMRTGLVRVGKYLFLVVAFPPYFALYGLPKWIVVEGIPAFISIYMLIWEKIQNQLEKYRKVGVHRIAQTTHFIEKLAQVFIRPFVHFILEIRRKVRDFQRLTFQFFKNHSKKLKTILNVPYAKLTEKIQDLKKDLSRIKSKLSHHATEMMVGIQERIQWVKESPQIILHWGQLQLQSLAQWSATSFLKSKMGFRASYELAQRVTDQIFKACKGGIDACKKHGVPLVNFYQQALKPPLLNLKASCQRKWQQARDFFHQKHQKALSFLQAKQDKVSRLSSKGFLNYFIFHPWMGKLPSSLQHTLKKILFHSITRSIFEGIIKIYSLLIKSLLRFVGFVLKTFSKGFAFTVKIRQQLLGAVKIIRQYSLTCFRGFRKWGLNTVYYFFLFLTMAFILCAWAIQLLGETMNTLISKYSFKRKMLG